MLLGRTGFVAMRPSLLGMIFGTGDGVATLEIFTVLATDAVLYVANCCDG